MLRGIEFQKEKQRKKQDKPEVLFIKPNYSECECQINVALSFFEEDKLTEALFHFNRAMEFDSKSPFAVANIASICAIWSKKHRALEFRRLSK